MKSIIVFVILVLLAMPAISIAQITIPTLTGRILQTDKKGNQIPVPFANVIWKNSKQGTVTDESGKFSLEKRTSGSHDLVISCLGFQTDTIRLNADQKYLEHTLVVKNVNLDEVEIRSRQEGQYISSLNSIKTEVISSVGLQRLACCNLSESFENSATVDVGYSDAVSGAKQIQMLGLAGVYSQLMFENIPFIRGVASPFGLGYVPGTWMQSIQISKGTSSVTNGFESITGQINVEFKKPEHTDEKLFINAYGSTKGRGELNIHTASKVTKNTSTMLFGHVSGQLSESDHQKDGFLDIPTGHQVNLFNRWTFNHPNGRGHSQFAVGIINETRKGGMTEYWNTSGNKDGLWGLKLKTERYQAFAKSGYYLDKSGVLNLGLQAAGTYHKQSGFFGLREYSSLQKSLYLNAILQIAISKKHSISTGISYQYDDYQEQFDLLKHDLSESIPGIFSQYTYETEKFTAIAGLRADASSYYGTFLTPRLHLRYALTEDITARASAGKGRRTAMLFAENTGYMASSRKFIIADNLKQEEAWNYGLNLTTNIHIDEARKITIALDAYNTSFTNQVVADADMDYKHLHFYNLTGNSFARSYQAEITAEPIKRLSITVAWRINDVKITESNDLVKKPFVSKHKGLLALSYSTRFDKWSFDVTTQYTGEQRLPDVSENPKASHHTEYSPGFFTIHAQITRRFKNIELYAGGENLTGYTQHHPIISADDPFSDYFDASHVWGPLMGAMYYAGVRIFVR